MNSWATIGLLNHTTGSLYATEMLWKWSAGWTKCWLYGLLAWLFFTLDAMPALTGVLSFLSYTTDGLKVYDNMYGYDKRWQWFVLVIPKAVFMSLYFPCYMIAMTNRPSESRLFFILGAICIWIVSLMWTADFGDSISSPFHWRHETYNKDMGQKQFVVDCLMTFSLLVSVFAIIKVHLGGSNSFEGFSRKLRTPFFHRQKILYVTTAYYILLGLFETVLCLFEQTWNSRLEHVDWVWPPDGELAA